MTPDQDGRPAEVPNILQLVEALADARAAEMARQLWAIWFMQGAVTALMFVAGARWWMS